MTDSRTTFAGRWRQAVAAVPDDTFLIWEGSDGAIASWSYAAFDDVVRGVQGGLRARGVERGDRVLLALRNSPGFVALWLAAAGMGACIVPCDPQSSERELALVIERTVPRLGVSGGRSRAALDSAAAQLSLATVDVDEDDVRIEALRGTPLTDAQAAETPQPEPRDAAAIMFTSGTTSAPKGVVVTQANYAFAGDVMAAAASLRRGDRHIVVLPLFHANAQYYSFASAISAGASVALMHTFSASGFLEQAARHGATHASLFAAPMRMILARGNTPVHGLALRHCWYAQNVTTEQYEELSALLGCTPRQLYGMTETIPAVLTNRPLDPRPDSMGTVTLGCTVDLHDLETGEAVRDGDTGEVVVGGVPGITLFDGYLDDPQTTAQSFCGAWFRTGDRAVRDSDGRYSFAGRGGDILKVAGENVSAVEVEAVLAAHPAVFEAAVAGEPDPVRDEVPIAYVVLRDDAARSTSPQALQAWCEQRLSPAKRPRRIHVVDELPRTSVGKIRKFMLPQLAGVAAGEPR
jgi:crotonobetaine/carnitine-CoA ligase